MCTKADWKIIKLNDKTERTLNLIVEYFVCFSFSVNNPRFAQLNTSQLYDYVSMGVYGDNRRSLWFVINLKSGEKLSKRDTAEVGKPLDKPNNDLSLDVQKVPFTIKLDQDSAQMKVEKRLFSGTVEDLFCCSKAIFSFRCRFILAAPEKWKRYRFYMLLYSSS